MHRDAAETWRDEYPFTSQAVDCGGLQYHYVDEGEGAQPIVCVHGNPTWSFYYRALIEHFRSSQRVLAVDHIGCGFSDKPARYPYRLATHTLNLVNWIDRLDLRRIVLVVHDWGGAIGLGAAIARPDRVSKLLILNTGAFPPPYVPLRIAACRLPWIGSWAIRYANAFAGLAVHMAIDRLDQLSANARNGLLYPYRKPADRVAIDGFVRDIPLTTRHPTYSVLARLERDLPLLADKPTRIVWGMKDWCFRPQCLRLLQGHLGDPPTRELADVGHYVMEEAAEEVIEALDELLRS